MRSRPSLRALLRDRSGLAALEFALIAPMMVFLLLASFDLVELMQANKRVGVLTASVSDVVSRDILVTDDELGDVFEGAEALLFPNDASTLSVRVTSLLVDSGGVARVVWSEREGTAFTPLTAGAAVAIPAGLRTAGSGVVMAESRLTYRTPLRFLNPGDITLNKVEYRRARVVDPVGRTDD